MAQQRPVQRRRKVVPRGLVQAFAKTPPVLEVEKAIEEITNVPAATIHRTAALTWAARAVASYQVCLTKPELQECLSFFYLGEHYREAALAHAAMGDEWQPLHAEIDTAMEGDRGTAYAAMRRRSTEENTTAARPARSSRRGARKNGAK